MDELVHHCIRELSFDGDLGCDVSRLSEFIIGFYNHGAEVRQQNVDDAYRAFVWSVIVQQPNVRVGTVPEGKYSEVYIAPQTSAKRKAKEKGQDLEEPSAPTTLQIVDDAKLKSLEELREQYGDRLRIAVDPETSFVAITGSHIRPSKLTPMVYSCLQLIARGREKGVSTIDLGKKTGYDQKTIHYLINQLISLDMILKLRQAGQALHVCVLKYFYERSLHWKEVREANLMAKEDAEEEKPVEGGEEGPTASASVTFDPIDTQHLASLPLIRSRIIKLLRASPNFTHIARTVLTKIGFEKPTKSDRRFFNTRLKELIDEGLVELVQVRGNTKKDEEMWYRCLRLVQTVEDQSMQVDEPAGVPPQASMGVQGNDGIHGLKMNLTLHKQIMNVIAESGVEGITLSEISDALGNFDRRTIELLLTRLESNPPPPHLGDLGVAQAMDHAGRERRYKYFTVAEYNVLAAKEGFSPGENKYHNRIDIEHVMQFAPMDASLFYNTEEDVLKHVDALRRPGTDVFYTSAGTKKKPKKHKNPILPDGTVKKGRPRKNPDAPPRKRPKAEGEPPRKRGRPPKAKPEPVDVPDEETGAAESKTPEEPEESEAPQTAPTEASSVVPQKRKRGRPPKPKTTSAVAEVDNGSSNVPGGRSTSAAGVQPSPSSARKRGRASVRMSEVEDAPSAQAIDAADMSMTDHNFLDPAQPSDRADVVASIVTQAADPEVPRSSPSSQVKGARKTPRKQQVDVASEDRPSVEDDADQELGLAAEYGSGNRGRRSQRARLSEVSNNEPGNAPTSVPGITRVENSQEQRGQEPTDAGAEHNCSRFLPETTMGDNQVEGPIPKRRGRPRKRKQPDEDEVEPKTVAPVNKRSRLSDPTPGEGFIDASAPEGMAGEAQVDLEDATQPRLERDGNLAPDSLPMHPKESIDDQSPRRSPRKPRPSEKASATKDPRRPRQSGPTPAQPEGEPTEHVLQSDKQPGHHAVRADELQYAGVPHDDPGSQGGVPFRSSSSQVADNALTEQTDVPLETPAAAHDEQERTSPVQNREHIAEPITDAGNPSRESGDASMPIASSSKSRVRRSGNLSHQRRENEYLRVLERLGGIAAVNLKVFQDAHLTLIEEMHKNGEPTSGPVGIRADKRTLDATLNKMVEGGKIKTLKTSVQIQTGASRSIVVAYLQSLSQEKVAAYLLQLGRSSFIPQAPVLKRIEEPMIFATGRESRPTPDLPLHLLRMDDVGDSKNPRLFHDMARTDELFSLDDQTVRDVLLSERSTLSQLYGYIIAKALRVRELHMLTVQAFHGPVQTPRVVSNEQRIIDISHYHHEIPASGYFALVSATEYSEELCHILGKPEERLMPVKDLPATVRSALRVGQSRSRTRIMELLEVLRALNIATPLTISISERPTITCECNLDYPTTFDFLPPGGDATQCTFWQFQITAPIHLWSISKDSPPFLRDAPVVTLEDCASYWRELKEVALNQDYAKSLAWSMTQSNTGPLGDIRLVEKVVCRRASWRTTYFFTWHQEQYMKKHVEQTSTGEDEADNTRRLRRVAWVTGAPLQAVQEYMARLQQKHEREKTRARRRAHRENRELREKKQVLAKAELARKAKAAKAQREKEWDSLIQSVHPQPLRGSKASRIRQIRSRFVATRGQDLERWRAEIQQTLQENPYKPDSLYGATRQAGAPSFIVIEPTNPPPPVVQNWTEPSIRRLIEDQGPAVAQRNAKNKQHSTAAQKPATRRRFNWTREYDELARDAAAVIKARCRDGTKLEWAALDAVFPSLNRNTARQRIVSLTKEAADAMYLKRLEDEWYRLWTRHRGTPLLPDDDPRSASNFDIVAHIEFLRKYIDKNALRVGFVQPAEPDATPFLATLPSSVEELMHEWNVVEKPQDPTWDFLWSNELGEEGREKSMHKVALFADNQDTPIVSETVEESIRVAEGALKMVFGAPASTYSPQKASETLRSVGQAAVTTATHNLLARGVLTKVNRDPSKPKPGRSMRISDSNQTASNGPIPIDTFADAAAFEESHEDQAGEPREWSLLASDGDIAALMQLVSDNKVVFDVDTAGPRAARAGLDWNSKKADDDEIETTIRFLVKADTAALPEETSDAESNAPLPATNDVEGPPAGVQHGATITSEVACCSLKSAVLPRGCLIDCEACLQKELASYRKSSAPESQAIIEPLLELVKGAGANGISKRQLLDDLKSLDRLAVLKVVHHLCKSPVPLLFWAGYSELVLVSALFATPWTVEVSASDGAEATEGKAFARVLPRRWLDLGGSVVKEAWTAALRALVGYIVFRPGISQAELRWRVRSVYDRQEINQVLCFLEGEGYIRRRRWPSSAFPDMNPLDEQEERTTYWFLGDRHWFHL
ncbi:hypothetical protein PUNSTDRAFT_139959 [Punctularia strigosozonata HHB-11173 SS5]|uniref:uncharacterized protein n=1 Tax=Punctularia strigosozonata (strain HHB-11173) TaxID=741275 RepID=UPI000441665E|nr:uncharacterized protein PUNSTDRAFT_139959 [Punctularia strigosozonata HHB-11173 SS5]EIN13408.1 hypothetical protein PUNSTDRAFT_139959 [Punctularia strigosozonata HHB-11173 SS5]